ncbi:MAG: patatin-like phospholipase family protein [Litoreibacter sp.]
MARKPQIKRINLGLQGGGAHGAFTWGALKRILMDERIEIAGMSGTSAGALNGAAVKSGLLENDRQGALDKLDWLWGEIGANDHSTLTDWMIGLTPSMVSKAMEFSPAFMAVDAISRITSPYAYGPLYSHPLRKIVEQFSFDNVCALDGPDLKICATNVRTGKIKLFSGHEISTDAILASGCLPTVFQTIEIEDPKTGVMEAYWDGGYMGNPALFPLYEEHLPEDIVIININPLHRDEIPKTAQDIANRINEISFNGSLFRELRSIEFVRRLIREDRMPEGAMKRVLIHMISDDSLMQQLSVATKIIPQPYVLNQLREAGERAAATFLDKHFDDIGVESSVNLTQMFS